MTKPASKKNPTKSTQLSISVDMAVDTAVNISQCHSSQNFTNIAGHIYCTSVNSTTLYLSDNFSQTAPLWALFVRLALDLLIWHFLHYYLAEVNPTWWSDYCEMCLKSCILLLITTRNSATTLTLSSSLAAMSRKWTQEHSTSSKFHCVAWTEKWTRRGAILTAEVITPSSPATPVKPRRHTTLQNTGLSWDQTPIPGGAIKEAMSLPPIPAPEILTSKKGWRGKVWNGISSVMIN